MKRSARRLVAWAVIGFLAFGLVAIYFAARISGGTSMLRRGMEVVQGWLNESQAPDGFSVSNGRIEAVEVDVATKLPGRLLAVLAEEGDTVEAGEVLARMDPAVLDAQLHAAQAQVAEAEEQRASALALVAQRESELGFARRELARASKLIAQQHVSEEQLDRTRTQVRSGEAALDAARAQVGQADAAIQAAQAGVQRVRVDIADSELKAPRRGRVLYRLAEPGEVLAGGQKVLTLLDLSDVYMVLFLPETVAGQVPIGAEARIVLDAAPQYVIPATVSFVSPRAQFTPKQVETRTEREKLVFRIKARIDPGLLKHYESQVKVGLPGVGYVRVDPAQEWPERLRTRLP